MSLHRYRLAVAMAFATQGFVFIGLTTRLPDIKDRWGFSELEVSLTLLAVVLLAGLGSVLAEKYAAGADSALILRFGLIGIGVGMPLMVAAPAVVGYAAGVAVYGVALGAVDAATNMQAVALEHRYGRPILPSFHGAWTLGGVLGTVLTLSTSWLPLAASAVVGALPLGIATLRYLPRDHGAVLSSPSATKAAPAIPWRPILLVGLGMVVFYMVDTASQTWGAVYLDEVYSAPARWLALATLPYLVASLLVRLAGDGLVARFGAVPVLRVGAVVACAGLALVVTAPIWPLAVVGFTVVGTGISVVAPLSFSAAAKIAGASGDAGQDRIDAVIARFNQFNYVGGLLGAVLTGVVGKDELRFGFVIPMILVLALLPLARHFAAVTAATTPPRTESGPGTARALETSEEA